jgi:hypothetical protein
MIPHGYAFDSGVPVAFVRSTPVTFMPNPEQLCPSRGPRKAVAKVEVE